MHIQIELDSDTLQDYSSFIQSRKSYLKTATLTNLSDSDSDHDFRLSNDDIEKIKSWLIGPWSSECDPNGIPWVKPWLRPKFGKFLEHWSKKS